MSGDQKDKIRVVRKRNRSVSKIDRLSPELKDTVEQMLLGGCTYKEIVSYLKENGVELSQMSVCRYAEKYLVSVERLRVAQENFRTLMDEIDKYPNLDTTEAILRIASQQVLDAISGAPAESWSETAPDKLMKNVTALIRAAAYKKKTDLQVKTDTETALEANKALLFDVLKKYPDLYKEVMDAIKNEKSKMEEGSV